MECCQKPKLDDETFVALVKDYPEMYHGNGTLLRCVAELVRLGQRYDEGLEVAKHEISLAADDLLLAVIDNTRHGLLEGGKAVLSIDFGKMSEADFRRLVADGDLSAVDNAKDSVEISSRF